MNGGRICAIFALYTTSSETRRRGGGGRAGYVAIAGRRRAQGYGRIWKLSPKLSHTLNGRGDEAEVLWSLVGGEPSVPGSKR